MQLTPEQVKGRIKNVAKENKADARTLMRIYMMERFLERVARCVLPLSDGPRIQIFNPSRTNASEDRIDVIPHGKYSLLPELIQSSRLCGHPINLACLSRLFTRLLTLS